MLWSGSVVEIEENVADSSSKVLTNYELYHRSTAVGTW